MVSQYLTPYDELIEATNLGERTKTAAMAQNPLYQRDAAILGGAAAPVAPVSDTTIAPNPFTRQPLITPPVPLSTMPVEQQMAWQNQAIKEAAEQRAAAKTALEIQITHRQEEQGVEAFRQGNAMIARSGELDPGDIKNYPLKRAQLAREHPLGAATPEVKAALLHLDMAYENTLQTEMGITKAEEANRRIEERGRLDFARKQAADLGPEALERFSKLEKVDRDAAITGVMQEAAKIKQANLEQQLIETGMTKEEIAAKYQRPEGFLFGAAEVGAKQRMTPAQQATQLRAHVSDLSKLRNNLTYYTMLPEPEKAELNANLKAAQEQYDAIQDRGMGDRAGVQGMVSPGAMQVAQQQAFNYANVPGPVQQQPAQAFAQQSVQQQVAAPAGPVRSEAPLAWMLPAAGRLATTMATAPARALWAMATPEAERARQAAARVVPTPAGPPGLAAAPAPEPIGTRKVINGVESIKLADGWHKIKTR